MTKAEKIKLQQAIEKIKMAYHCLLVYRQENDNDDLKFVSRQLDEGIYDETFGLNNI
jgi:hypothetical protein